MKTVHAVSELTGVSVRALHYYDDIGLLHPSEVTEAGYRLYDDAALERLQQILLFRELEFPLKEIREILDSADFDREKALTQHIALLELKREHIENLLAFAREIKVSGERTMDFSAFDKTKLDEYAAQAKAAWGETDAYKEYAQKNGNRTHEEEMDVAKDMMEIFAGFGKLQSLGAASDEAQRQVEKLRSFITERYYTCTPEILNGLGAMYPAGGEMTDNIEKAGGAGTAAFAAEAIAIYCKKAR